MRAKHNPRLTPFAKQLRKEMTKEERHLWYDYLRGYPIRFLRQKVLGQYVADFYCAKAALVIELDGSQHYDEEAIAKDAERTAYLEGYGLRVIRIPNNEVNGNFEGVCRYIDAAVKDALGGRQSLRQQPAHGRACPCRGLRAINASVDSARRASPTSYPARDRDKPCRGLRAINASVDSARRASPTLCG